MNSTLYDFIPILMQIAFSAIVIFLILGVSAVIGPKRKSNRKNANFECGLEPLGSARTPFAIKYFLVAILFVIFDIEIVFMYPWAINFKELGAPALLKMIGFLVLLFIGYLYIVKRKALDWEK